MSCQQRERAVICAAIVSLSPGGLDLAGLISDDAPILFSHTLVLYFLARWQETNTPYYLKAGIISAFTAFMIKGSAVIALGTVGVMLLIALYQKQITWRKALPL